MILLYNAAIYKRPKKDNALIVKDEKIHFIGNLKEIPNFDYEIKVNLNGKLLLPSFIDVHTHFSEYLKLKNQINFSEAKTLNDIFELLDKYPDKTKGYGLKMSFFDKSALNKIFKNLKRKKQITVVSSDYHSYFTTEIGLTPWPPLNNNNCFPKLQTDDFNELYKYGITSIHEMAFDKTAFYFYNENIKNRLEVIRHFPLEILDEIIQNRVKNSDYLNTRSLKLFYDGSLGSDTAFMFNNPNSYINWEKEFFKIEKLLIKALDNNIPVSVHAIGDKAVDDIVNLFTKYKNRITVPLRIEHVQTIRDETIEKLYKIKDKVALTMQPLHIRDDIALIERKKLEKYSFRFRSLKEMNIGFSSDVPVVEANPFKAVYYAIENPINSLEKISVEDAIDNYTVNAAKLSEENNIKGSMEKGKFANLTVIDDFRNKNTEFWCNAKSYLTLIRGNIVYNDLK